METPEYKRNGVDNTLLPVELRTADAIKKGEALTPMNMDVPTFEALKAIGEANFLVFDDAEVKKYKYELKMPDGRRFGGMIETSKNSMKNDKLEMIFKSIEAEFKVDEVTVTLTIQPSGIVLDRNKTFAEQNTDWLWCINPLPFKHRSSPRPSTPLQYLVVATTK